MKTDRPHLFEIKDPSHVHDFSPGPQKRSGDQQVIVDRMPSDTYKYTYGIYLQRHEKTVVWTHAETCTFVQATTTPKAGAIAGEDQYGKKQIFDLKDNEAIGLLAVMATWTNEAMN